MNTYLKAWWLCYALLVCSKNHGGDHPSRASQEPKEGEDPPLVPKSDADALELLRRKFRRDKKPWEESKNHWSNSG